jgi:hypothetical protein
VLSNEKEANIKRQLLVWCANYLIQNRSEARRVLPGSVAPVLNNGNKFDSTGVTGHWSTGSQEVPGSVLDIETYYLD